METMSKTTDHDCDICGSTSAEEIICLRRYTGGRPIHVCRECGFVYVRSRRTFQEIADAWSYELYGIDRSYTAHIPAIKARQAFVAHSIDTELGLKGKRICDIGAGEGLFLAMLTAPEYGAEAFGIEPSPLLCEGMTDMGIANFTGTIENYLNDPNCADGAFDIVTVIWTLENCESCKFMMRGAERLLKPGGHVVVATGSRILVPFKKPLQYYVGNSETDTHNFRFSANSLERLLGLCGFEKQHVNRYIDSDVLCMIGQKNNSPAQLPDQLPSDDWRKVVAFFERWDAETRAHYADN